MAEFSLSSRSTPFFNTCHREKYFEGYESDHQSAQKMNNNGLALI